MWDLTNKGKTMTTILNAFLRYITVIETTLVFTAFSITAYVCNQ